MLLSLSILSFLGSIIFGVYCLWEWFRTSKKYFYFVLFGVSFLCLFWFQLPMIFAYLGMRFNLSDYSQLLSLAFPLAFASSVLMYVGFIRALKFPLDRKSRGVYILLFALSFVICGWSLFTGEGQFNAPKILTFSVVIIFFASPHLLVLEVFFRTFRNEFYKVIKPALLLGHLAFLLILIQDAMVAVKIFQYPPGLLFFGLTSYKPLFYLQIISTFLTILSILLLRRFSMNLSDIRYEIKRAVRQNQRQID